MPIYLFPSGLPQLFHLLFLIFALCCLSWLPPARGHSITAHWFLGSLCYTIAIRQCFFAMTQGIEGINVLTPISYIFYNAVVFVAVFRYLENYTLGAFHAGVLLSILISLLGVALYGFSFIAIEGAPYRTVGTFNNPNQLGYYALCLTGIGAIGYLRGGIPKISFILVFLGCAFLTIMSLSRAAIIGMMFYFLIFFRWREVRRFLPVFVITAVVIGFIVVKTDVGMKNLKLYHRLESVGERGNADLEERGYGLLLHPDTRIIYGYGEGYVKKFIQHEMHSTIGNILISYGLLGVFLFVSILFLIFVRIAKRFGFVAAIGLMGPVMMYGFTHNGFRFTIFWIYLAVAYSDGSVYDNTRQDV